MFTKHHILGGGYRKNVVCPHCKSRDRDRWLLWVLKNYTNIFEGKVKVLHIAPEWYIDELIMNNQQCDYYSGNINRTRGRNYIDICDIPFRDDFFDYIIVNHVLEHIEDLSKAMEELYRVLRNDGKIVMSFPICVDQKTYSSPSICSDKERWEFYGQSDHVRLFGNDYREILKSYGWHIREYTPSKLCTSQEINRYGFLYDDILMILNKEAFYDN